MLASRSQNACIGVPGDAGATARIVLEGMGRARHAVLRSQSRHQFPRDDGKQFRVPGRQALKRVFGKFGEVRVAGCDHGCAPGLPIDQRHFPRRFPAAKLRHDTCVFAGQTHRNPQSAAHHQVKRIPGVILAKERGSRLDPFRLQLSFELTQGGLSKVAKHPRCFQRNDQAVLAQIECNKSIDRLDRLRMVLGKPLEAFPGEFQRAHWRDCANRGQMNAAGPESELSHHLTRPALRPDFLRVAGSGVQKTYLARNDDVHSAAGVALAEQRFSRLQLKFIQLGRQVQKRCGVNAVEDFRGGKKRNSLNG